MYGQIGRGTITYEIQTRKNQKPERIDFFTNKIIIHIVCDYHCLALSSNGKVYGRVNNKKGQVGCGEGPENFILFQLLIDFEFPIKFIDRSEVHSFAVDIRGNAFFWGNTSNGIQWKPKKIFVENVNKIQLVFIVNKCIVLTESGRLFVYSFNENNIMFEISIGLRIDDILYNLCESEECVYELTNEQGHLS